MRLVWDLAYRKYGQSFLDKLQAICRKLGINPSDLLVLMYSESGLDHTRFNGIGCYGLIQFCDKTWVAQMQGQSAFNQLDWVYKYYAGLGVGTNRKVNNFFELYLINFYPVAWNYRYQDNYVFGSEPNASLPPSVIRNANFGFDLNGDGKITMAEFRRFCANKLRTLQGLKPLSNNLSVGTNEETIVWFALGGLFLLGLLKKKKEVSTFEL